MTLVVDASVAIKWVVNEGGHDAAVAASRGERVVGPDFALIEAANILWRKVRLKELTRDQAIRGHDFIRQAYADLMPSAELLDRAFAVSLEIDHLVYDCLYLACAEQLRCGVITADHRLGAKRASIQSVPITVLGS